MVNFKVRIIINSKQKLIELPIAVKKQIRRACIATLYTEKYDKNTEVNITLVDNQEIKELNKRYRNIDEATDVLSFPMEEVDPADGYVILGDIVMSAEKIVEQAQKYGSSFRREASYLVVHSVLHLLGYDHQNTVDKMSMRKKEEEIMSLIGFPMGISSHVMGINK